MKCSRSLWDTRQRAVKAPRLCRVCGCEVARILVLLGGDEEALLRQQRWGRAWGQESSSREGPRWASLPRQGRGEPARAMKPREGLSAPVQPSQRGTQPCLHHLVSFAWSGGVPGVPPQPMALLGQTLWDQGCAIYLLWNLKFTTCAQRHLTTGGDWQTNTPGIGHPWGWLLL